MSYAEDFISTPDSARKILLEGGYSSAAAVEAVKKLSELCLYVLLTGKLTEDYIKGENLPAYFENEISMEPILLRGSDMFDILSNLEEQNIIVRRGKAHRVMITNMMNRIFTLTAPEESGSIRSDIKKFGDNGNFEEVLDTVEWELVSRVHERIDMQYIDISKLEELQTPKRLDEAVEKCEHALDKMKSMGIDITAKRHNDISEKEWKKEKGDTLTEYIESVIEMSSALNEESQSHFEIIIGASGYPKSLLDRSGPPLIKSSWVLRPDLRNHPLIKKFIQLTKSNLQSMAKVIDIYEDNIRLLVDRILEFPQGIFWVTQLPESAVKVGAKELTEIWVNVRKHGNTLKSQALMLERVLSNIDSLFQTEEN